MSSDRTYQGWANYETWAVKLWIDNEEGSYNYWRDRTREVWDDSSATQYMSRSQQARYTLSDALKSEHEENMPDSGGVYGDLLGAALCEVDWREIADAMLRDMNESLEDDADITDCYQTEEE